MVQVFLDLFVFMAISKRIAADYPWTFDNDLFGGPDFWGLVSKTWRMCTVGQLQSPINIDPSRLLFDPGLTSIVIGHQQIEAEFRNAGPLPIVTVNDTNGASGQINVTGGPAGPYNYRLHHVMFHFGRLPDGEMGSEHTIDKVRFPAEIQLLCYNSDLYENFTQAMTQPRGLLALSFIVDIGDASNVELRKLTVASQSITYKDSVTTLTRFQPSGLLSNIRHYVTYEGSLTYPGCYETVTWVIMNNPIYITREDQTEIKQPNPVFMGPNYRPLKPLNGRLIRTNIDVKYESRSAGGTCPSNIYLDMGYRSNPRRLRNASRDPDKRDLAKHLSLETIDPLDSIENFDFV
uniref:Alpha-carbonic anhydrase domain-containing protein n=1 Tax=Acrobeloides nanus TaxID=290746 RepID=A0A914EDZ8_9BILA